MSVAQLTREQAAEENMRQYLQDIRQFPRLTEAQELALARGCAQGDAEAIKTMVNANLRLVAHIARDFAGRGVPLLDLIQEGSIGLISAAKKYDISQGTRFSTYASHWIRQGMARCVLSDATLIRVPHYTAERMGKVLAVRERLRQELEREPSAQELAQVCGLPENKVEELMQLFPQVCSLDSPLGEDGSNDLQQLLHNWEAPQPQEELVRQELKNTLEGLLSLLTTRQQQVLRLRYGMEDGVCHTMESIGAQLGISKERVRQIDREAIAKLKKMGADLGLEDYLF